MKVLGINSSINTQGKVITTLHVAEEFNSYYNNKEAGRTCEGMKVDSIYVGTVDCSAIKVGMDIDVLYEKAVTTANGGVYQPIKRIDIIG